MKKTIRDSVFVEAPVNVQDDHIEVASVRVDTHGIRGLTIEEQVAQLRQRCERAEAGADWRQQQIDHYRRHITALELKVKSLRKKLRAKR